MLGCAWGARGKACAARDETGALARGGVWGGGGTTSFFIRMLLGKQYPLPHK